MSLPRQANRSWWLEEALAEDPGEPCPTLSANLTADVVILGGGFARERDVFGDDGADHFAHVGPALTLLGEVELANGEEENARSSAVAGNFFFLSMCT